MEIMLLPFWQTSHFQVKCGSLHDILFIAFVFQASSCKKPKPQNQGSKWVNGLGANGCVKQAAARKQSFTW
jgi:hypothetical protein